jgi:hypothetical protein
VPTGSCGSVDKYYNMMCDFARGNMQILSYCSSAAVETRVHGRCVG